MNRPSASTATATSSPLRAAPLRSTVPSRPTLPALSALLGLLLLAGPAGAAEAGRASPGRADPPARLAGSTSVPIGALPAGATTIQLPFHQLGRSEPMRLQVLDGGQTLPFSVRTDEVVTDLRLRLRITLGPELLRGTQLKVLLNDESVALLPLQREAGNGAVNRAGTAGTGPTAGTVVTRDLLVDPRRLTDYNRLQLQLVAPRERVCERLDRDQLWVRVEPDSALTLAVERLPISDDLALLPAPFFDARDNRRLDLALRLPPQPSAAVLQTAGVLASWFGALASYRGAALRSLADGDGLPPQHAVVLATPAHPPAGLVLPAISGPSVTMVAHPTQPHAKLLLVLGRDDDELRSAAQALVLGQLDLSGPLGVPRSDLHAPARVPYDAPTWLATHRPVRFSDMPGVTPAALRALGAHPAPVKVDFRLPPDLHFTRQDTVPLALRWSYTVPPGADRSALRLAVNGNHLRQFNLSSLGLLDGWFGLPLAGQMKHEHQNVAVAGGLFARQPMNQVAMRFDYDVPVDDACHPRPAGQQLSEIDPGSTIDFSGVPHFIGLPNLTAFANGGFPYSRLADLSGTAVLLPEQPNRAELDAYLTLLSHLGRSTGYPALGLQVGSAADLARLADRDLLVIGTPGRQPLLHTWAAHLPLRVMADQAAAAGNSTAAAAPGEPSDPARLDPGALQLGWSQLLVRLGWRTHHETPTLGAQDAAALAGFESPLTSGRSVVVLTANRPEQLAGVAQALLTPALLGDIHGQVSLVEQGKVRSFDDGPSYYNGDVSVLQQLRFIFARYPLGLAALLSLVAVALAVACASALRRQARRRLPGPDQADAPASASAGAFTSARRPSLPGAPASMARPVPETSIRPQQP